MESVHFSLSFFVRLDLGQTSEEVQCTEPHSSGPSHMPLARHPRGCVLIPTIRPRALRHPECPITLRPADDVTVQSGVRTYNGARDWWRGVRGCSHWPRGSYTPSKLAADWSVFIVYHVVTIKQKEVLEMHRFYKTGEKCKLYITPHLQ